MHAIVVCMYVCMYVFGQKWILHFGSQIPKQCYNFQMKNVYPYFSMHVRYAWVFYFILSCFLSISRFVSSIRCTVWFSFLMVRIENVLNWNLCFSFDFINVCALFFRGVVYCFLSLSHSPFCPYSFFSEHHVRNSLVILWKLLSSKRYIETERLKSIYWSGTECDEHVWVHFV